MRSGFTFSFWRRFAGGMLGAGMAAWSGPLAAQTVVDFGDVALTTPPATAYDGGGVYYDGSDLAGGFTSRGVDFTTQHDSNFGSWTGWIYSSTTDVTTPGWSNQYSAFAGSGSGDAVYAIGYTGLGPLSLNLPGPSLLDSVALTNTTYAGLSMTLGDDFAKKFGGADGTDPDTFKLTIEGFDLSDATTGTVEFFLADFRATEASADYIIQDWTLVDLSGLGSEVSRLEFSLSSTDNGVWGMNTPAYFALDDLTFTAIPEPRLLPLLAGLSAIALSGRRSRRRAVGAN